MTNATITQAEQFRKDHSDVEWVNGWKTEFLLHSPARFGAKLEVIGDADVWHFPDGSTLTLTSHNGLGEIGTNRP